MTVSSAQAAAQYQKTQRAYTPKQEIQKTDTGTANVAFYEDVAGDIAASLAEAVASGGEEAREAAITISAPPVEKPLNPVFLASIEQRKKEVAPLAEIYVQSMDVDPESELGKEQVKSAIEFYSRNEQVLTRFKMLVKNLGG